MAMRFSYGYLLAGFFVDTWNREAACISILQHEEICEDLELPLYSSEHTPIIMKRGPVYFDVFGDESLEWGEMSLPPQIYEKISEEEPPAFLDVLIFAPKTPA